MLVIMDVLPNGSFGMPRLERSRFNVETKKEERLEERVEQEERDRLEARARLLERRILAGADLLHLLLELVADLEEALVLDVVERRAGQIDLLR